MYEASLKLRGYCHPSGRHAWPGKSGRCLQRCSLTSTVCPVPMSPTALMGILSSIKSHRAGLRSPRLGMARCTKGLMEQRLHQHVTIAASRPLAALIHSNTAMPAGLEIPGTAALSCVCAEETLGPVCSEGSGINRRGSRGRQN
ncbi:hypothetical protein E2C01_005432 [Portunus trituberculatus]|uniref:Uncharacterized protein n=1 Tax=Portunus trituberculatus TaxID=210409 RepID=A0A5B7CWM9_PORTR|nr:hypothetical protein [Portunus trituberculatus]